MTSSLRINCWLRLPAHHARIFAPIALNRRLAGRIPAFEGFAASIAARYCTPRAAPPLDSVILRRPRMETVAQIHAATDVRIALPLRIDVAGSRSMHLHTERIERFTPVLEPRLVSYKRDTQTLIERLTAREVRSERGIEAPILQHLSQGEASDAYSGGSPMAMVESGLWPARVFRRQVPASTTEAHTVDAARQQSLKSFAPERSTSTRLRADCTEPGYAVSPCELKRITDHVLQTIDHQIVASRERRAKR